MDQQSSLQVVDSPKEQLELIAKYFLSNFQGTSIEDTYYYCSQILKTNIESPGVLSKDSLLTLIAEALKSAYLQGFAESSQSGAGSFDLNIDVQLPLMFAIHLVKELNFCVKTAYRLGRQHGQAMKRHEKAIAQEAGDRSIIEY